MREVIRFFNQSNCGKYLLRLHNVINKIKRCLVAIGNTRFSSLYWAARALLKNLESIQELADAGLIITGIDDMRIFKSGTQGLKFKLDLSRFVGILEPAALALKCLESPHTNPADVFVFWVATAAAMNKYLTSEEFSEPVKRAIRLIVNKRFNGMINKSPSDVYFAAFFLSPSKFVNLDSAL